MDRAVSGALRITRAGSIAPRAVDFARVLESAYRSAEPECVRRAARVSLDVDHLPGLTLRGDEIALEQLCLNLLINAAQSLRGGGDIAVKARNLGATIELSITDSGVGMTTAQLAELEQPYRSTRRDGTGLGLKIARRIVLNHHGELTFESAPGAGTTVRVRLPT